MNNLNIERKLPLHNTCLFINEKTQMKQDIYCNNAV